MLFTRQENWQRIVRQETLDLFGVSGPVQYDPKVGPGWFGYHSVQGGLQRPKIG